MHWFNHYYFETYMLTKEVSWQRSECTKNRFEHGY